MDLEARAAGIGALADPIRRALYRHVVDQTGPVSRDEAAAATGVAHHTAVFHLDKLVEEGLLEVEFKRLSGRSGPGAGRPSKLYRRAAAEISVSLPPRSYDLVGDILAAAIGRTTVGVSLEEALHASAYDAGAETGRRWTRTGADALGEVAAALSEQGYEPQVTEDEVVLRNCPFDVLARKHTALVCGVNRDYVQGVADGAGHQEARACLDPEDGLCCVRVRPA